MVHEYLFKEVEIHILEWFLNGEVVLGQICVSLEVIGKGRIELSSRTVGVVSLEHDEVVTWVEAAFPSEIREIGFKFSYIELVLSLGRLIGDHHSSVAIVDLIYTFGIGERLLEGEQVKHMSQNKLFKSCSQ